MIVNLLAPVTGFDAAVLLITPFPILIVYFLAEVFAVLLPIAVIGNTLIVVAPQLWLVWAGFAGTVVLSYLAYGSYVDWQRVATWREALFSMPDPVLWTPKVRPKSKSKPLRNSTSLDSPIFANAFPFRLLTHWHSLPSE